MGMASETLTIPIPINEIGMRLPPNHRQTTYRFMLDAVLVIIAIIALLMAVLSTVGSSQCDLTIAMSRRYAIALW